VSTFVLVHGAMHGGWCWRAVSRNLQAAGHEVYAPTLTGLAERRQSLTRDTGVETHVSDLTELLWFEDLHDVSLVLHSYAGILAGPVAERAGDRLASIAFLGAFLTEPGQCLLDVEPPEVAARYRRIAEQGDGWLIPASPAFLGQWGVPERLHGFVGSRLTDFPLRCQVEPTEYEPSALSTLRCTYVWHADPPLDSLEGSREMARGWGWPILEVPYGHDMMLQAPEETARVLDALAEAAPS
jgi:pimeloyl-ACP methyl ester carboxylesterase